MSLSQYPIINSVYMHYKGGLYKCVCLSKHTETGEQLVTYQDLRFGTYHSCPVEHWLEPVELDPFIKQERYALLEK